MDGNYLFKAIGNDAVRCIIGGNADLNPVPFNDLDPMLFHAARQNTAHFDVVIAFNFHHPATQNFGDHTF